MKDFKMADVGKTSTVVPPNKIREEMTFTDSESEDELVHGTESMRLTPYTETQEAVEGKRKESEQEEMTFTDSESASESEETGPRSTPIWTMPVPVTEVKEAIAEKSEELDPMTFTDSESETEAPEEPEEEESELQKMTFTDSESETDEVPEITHMRSMTIPVAKESVPVTCEGEDPEQKADMTYSDVDSDSGPEFGNCSITSYYVGDSDEETGLLPLETVDQKRGEPEQETEMTFTDSESESDEVVPRSAPFRAMTILFTKPEVPQEKWEESEQEMTFSYSESDSESEKKNIPSTMSS